MLTSAFEATVKEIYVENMYRKDKSCIALKIHKSFDTRVS